MTEVTEPLQESSPVPMPYKDTTIPVKNKFVQLKIDQKRKKQALTLTDTILVLIVVGPLTIGCWRGMWELVDIYDDLFPYWETFIIGNILYLILTISREKIEKWITFDANSLLTKILDYAVKKLYTYMFAWIGVCYWNRGWCIYDSLFDIETLDTGLSVVKDDIPLDQICLLVIFHICLACLKCYRNILSVPFVMGVDTKSTYFQFPTRFRKTMEEKTTLYVLDCLFSVFIIGTLVVFVWRGAWVLIDIYLFPENEYWSAWGSLILGYTAVAIAFLIQPIMRWLCDRLSGILRLLIADIFLFFSFVGTVNVWRGIWNLLNLYFIPEDLELSSWITHWICLVLLILLKCSNTLLVRGVYIDADEPAGKCVVFPIYYLRLIFQRERAKKINKKFQVEAMSRRKIELDSIKTECTCGTELKNHVAKENDQNHCPDL